MLGAVAGAVAGHKLQDGVSDWKDNRDEEKEKKKREEEERKREEEERKRREEQQAQQQHHGGFGGFGGNNHHNAPPPQYSGGNHHESSRGVNYAGNFSGSSRDVRLDAHGEYMLHASCRRTDGSYQQSSISLNRLIENDQGSFRWASQGHQGGGGNTVTVQHGDTLREIARRHGASFEELARHNGIQNPDMIYPGQVIQVPGRSGGGGGGNFGASARDVRVTDGGRRLEGELLRDGRWCGSSIELDERIGNNNGTLSFC